MNKDEFLRQVGAAINDWDKEKLVDLVNRGIHDGFTPLELTHDVLLPTLQKACRDMDAYNITFPELVLQADTIKAALDVLIPMIKTSFSERKIKGRVVIGTVSGDIHDFGKTLVAAIFESGGYRVVDLGRDVPTEEFIRAAKEEKAERGCRINVNDAYFRKHGKPCQGSSSKEARIKNHNRGLGNFGRICQKNRC